MQDSCFLPRILYASRWSEYVPNQPEYQVEKKNPGYNLEHTSIDAKAVPDILKLLTQIHALLAVQLPEIRIIGIVDETYCFTRRFHFRSQFLIHLRELIE